MKAHTLSAIGAKSLCPTLGHSNTTTTTFAESPAKSNRKGLMMMRSTVLCALLCFPLSARTEELPEPFFGLASGGHYCETEEQMLDYLGLLDLIELGELAPMNGLPPGCGEMTIGEPLYYEPVRWLEYTTAHVLLGRVTHRDMKVSYVYLNVRIKPDA